MRKLYSYAPSKQHTSVRNYVGRNRDGIDDYLNANAARVLAEKDAAKAAGKRYLGHDMGYAKGSLKSAFTKSLGRATSGGGVNKEMSRLRRLGRPTSVAKVRKNMKAQHVVKFGVDPYHS